MGKHITINHRRPPPEAGIPKIARHSDGKLVPLHPEPVLEPPLVTQLRAELGTVQGRVQTAEEITRVKTAEVVAFKESLLAARAETETVRQQLREIEGEGLKFARIEIISVDGISREDDTATIHALCDVDGTIGETIVVLTVAHLRELLKRKSDEEPDEEPEPVPEVRDADEDSDVPDGPDYSAEASGIEL